MHLDRLAVSSSMSIECQNALVSTREECGITKAARSISTDRQNGSCYSDASEN